MSDIRGALIARVAEPRDVPRITEIYNQGIADRVATFETQPRTEDTVRGWLDSGYPVIVVERDGEVLAWANTSSYRPRACYDGNAEFSVYVDRAARGLGAGTVAMRALIDAARDHGLEKLVSRVFTENHASRRLLRSVGFREAGVYERHARLDGVWRDVVIVERLLNDRAGEPHGALWQPELPTLDLWPELTPGTRVLVEKLPWEPDRPIVRYEGEIMTSSLPAPWVEVRAEWTLRDIDIAGLAFRVGDELREFFSPRHPFNAFAVYAPDGTLRGWYGNVTRPARLRRDDHGLVLTWPDLVLDVVVLPDGTVIDLDEEELAESGMRESQPEIAAQMIAARDQLREMLVEGFFPSRR